jgi:hypothetical protein
LTQANTVLRQRTETLANEVERVMGAKGTSEEEIDDFKAEFRLYDDTARGGQSSNAQWHYELWEK